MDAARSVQAFGLPEQIVELDFHLGRSQDPRLVLAYRFSFRQWTGRG